MLKTIVFGIGLTVDDRVLGKRVTDGCLQRIGDDLLTVVVIDGLSLFGVGGSVRW